MIYDPEAISTPVMADGRPEVADDGAPSTI